MHVSLLSHGFVIGPSSIEFPELHLRAASPPALSGACLFLSGSFWKIGTGRSIPALTNLSSLITSFLSPSSQIKKEAFMD